MEDNLENIRLFPEGWKPPHLPELYEYTEKYESKIRAGLEAIDYLTGELEWELNCPNGLPVARKNLIRELFDMYGQDYDLIEDQRKRLVDSILAQGEVR